MPQCRCSDQHPTRMHSESDQMQNWAELLCLNSCNKQLPLRQLDLWWVQSGIVYFDWQQFQDPLVGKARIEFGPLSMPNQTRNPADERHPFINPNNKKIITSNVFQALNISSGDKDNQTMISKEKWLQKDLLVPARLNPSLQLLDSSYISVLRCCPFIQVLFWIRILIGERWEVGVSLPLPSRKGE